MFFDEKWSLGRPRFDLFSHFGRLLRVLKIAVCLMPHWDFKKSEKSDIGAHRGRHVDFGCSASALLHHRGVPIPMKRKTILQQNSNTGQRIPTSPWAEGLANLKFTVSFFNNCSCSCLLSATRIIRKLKHLNIRTF